MYRDYGNSEVVDFSVLKGKTLKSVVNTGDTILFTTTEDETYRQVYYEDCCASCDVEEIHGDLEDLVGTPILMAEEVSNREPSFELQAERAKAKAKAEAENRYYYYDNSESETWTFYKAATIKGSVTIRWYGSSNGYYSESPTFELVKKRSDNE